MNDLIHLKNILASVIYSIIGIAILVVSFWIVEKVTPENMWREVVVNKNNAIAIVAAAFVIAIAIIIASAIH